MNETLLEFVDSRGAQMRVDRQHGIVRGVKVLGLTSRNGRLYLPTALERAAPLYEGARVNVNHPAGDPKAPRDYRDRVGSVQAVTYRPGEGLFGDLHYNPKHSLAEQLAWDAEHGGENVGLSHNVEARVSRSDGRLVVEEITKVHSVDLVASPATTRGLYEQAAAEADAETAELRLQVQRLSEELRQAHQWRLANQLVSAARARWSTVDADATGAILDDALLESAARAADEAAVRRTVDERVRLVETLLRRKRSEAEPAPQSATQRMWEGGQRRTKDATEFARAIRT